MNGSPTHVIPVILILVLSLFVRNATGETIEQSRSSFYQYFK